MTIDLHVHTTASDGTQTPAEVVEAAASAAVDVIAITDHDTTSGWAEALEAGRRLGVGVVPGAELSCHHGRISVHMLAYLPDPQAGTLVELMTRVRDDRIDRLRRMVGLIASDHDVTWADVEAQIGSAGGVEATVGRPHVADALIARGIVHDRDEAFATILHGRSGYYVPHYAPDAVTLVRAVVDAGGVPVIAHPRADHRGPTLTDTDLAELVGAGMAGIEVDHRDHTPADRAALRELAHRLGVFTTGSSDYHATGKRNRLGENTTAPEVLERLLATGTGAKAYLP